MPVPRLASSLSPRPRPRPRLLLRPSHSPPNDTHTRLSIASLWPTLTVTRTVTATAAASTAPNTKLTMFTAQKMIRRKKNVKKGIQFCLMVCGASGTGELPCLTRAPSTPRGRR